MPARVKTREHGTRAKYVVERCRCEDCRRSVREYERWRSRQRAYGRTAYVDAEPVRAHLRSLSAHGLGWKRAAAQAGVATSTVWKLLYGDPDRGQAPSKRCRRRTARALLAITATVDRLGGGTLVPAIGTQRRLQALVAIGWSQAQLARRLNMQASNFGRTMRADEVRLSTARAASALYEQLWATPPAEVDAASRQSAARARNFARRNGWVPPLAWDDDSIDDPDARPPDLGERAPDGVDLDEVRHLEKSGAHVEEIAKRLRCSVSKIKSARRRARDEVTA